MVKLRLFSHRDVVKACSKTVRESVSRAKRGVRIAAIGFICVAASGLNIAVAALPIVVTDALTKAGLPADSIGLVVERVSDQRVLYSHQAERSFHTASTMKLLTT
ncbi:MAG: D-alanyl-D-alanine carboxypeptidase, partial [Casimicrobium sp.]